MNSELLDKVPPHSLAAERAVIGSVLLKPSLFADMNLDATDFHSNEHQTIWRAFDGLTRGGVGIDIITVRDCLKAQDAADNNSQELAEDHSLSLAEAAQSVPVSAHWKHYRDIVVRTCAKRSAVGFAVEMLQGAHDDGVEPEDWVSLLLTRGERMRDWIQEKRGH